MLNGFGVVHALISVFFGAMILSLIVRMILSWLPIPQNNPFTLFFMRLTDPIILPVERRMPAMTVGPLDISGTVAFIFAWWALGVVGALLISGLPMNW